MPKATKKVAKKTTKKVVPKPYFLKVEYNDNVFETKATSLKEAVKEFVKSDAFDRGVKTKVILNYGDKEITKTTLLNVSRARRVFAMWGVKGDNSITSFANQLERSLA